MDSSYLTGYCSIVRQWQGFRHSSHDLLGSLLYSLGTENGGLVFVLTVRVSGVRLVSCTLVVKKTSDPDLFLFLRFTFSPTNYNVIDS